MVFPIKVIAILVTVFFRDFYRRLNYAQVVPLPGAALPSVEIFGSLAFVISGICYYMTRGQVLSSARSARAFSRSKMGTNANDSIAETTLPSNSRTENRVEKAKTWATNKNFHGSRGLQQHARRYVSNEARFSGKVNTGRNVSRFIPTRSKKEQDWYAPRRSPRHQKCDLDLQEPEPSTSGNANLKHCYSYHKDVYRPPKHCPVDFCGCRRSRSPEEEDPVGMRSSQRNIPLIVEPEPSPLRINDVPCAGPSWMNSAAPDELPEEQNLRSVSRNKLHHQKIYKSLCPKNHKYRSNANPTVDLHTCCVVDCKSKRNPTNNTSNRKNNTSNKHVLRKTRSGKVYGGFQQQRKKGRKKRK